MVTSKSVRALAAAALSLGLAVSATACSTPQTLKSYTPAEGVSVDVTPAPNAVPLKVRNLMILSQGQGKGTLAGAIIAPKADTLKAVGGQLVTAQGEDGDKIGPAQADLQIKPNEPALLLEQSAIQLTAASLTPGQTARLVLQFQNAGPVQVTVPVVDGSKADYKTVSPKPAASGSATPGAEGSATPTATP